MSDARDDPFSDSRFFSGRIRPSMQDMAEPTRFSDMAMPAYSTAATGSLFAPGAGVTDIMGFAPDPAQPGEFLPSFGQNIAAGNYLDAGLQTLGGAGDVMMAGGAFVPPLAAVGAALKAPRAASVASRIKVTKTADVSDTFGEGAKSITYTDPDSGGFIEVVNRKDGPTSVLGLEVPEEFRGSGIGQELQAAAMADFPMLQGQVSSKAAAVGAYRLGRRPVGRPDATLEEVFGIIDDQSSVLMRRPDPNQQMGDALARAQARYFETGNFEPPTAENPVSVVLPTETEPGIIAFHGSGADFDEFRLEMIGTGEGAQAYGYGLYFTDSEDIAKFYRNAMADRGAAFGVLPIKYKGQSFTEFEDSAAAEADPLKFRMLNALGRKIESYTGVVGLEAIVDIAKSDLLNRIDKNIEQQRAAFANESASVQATMEDALLQDIIAERDALARIDPADIEVEKPGKIYKVALTPKPDELLDYDVPIGSQSPDIKAKISELIDNEITPDDLENFGSPRGDLKASLLSENRTVVSFLNDFAAIRGKDNAGEELLAKYGIPGIKYRAAGSRGAGTSDEAAERNYVIFDDRAVKILEKYGIVGPVLVTGGAVAATQRGGDEEGSIFPDA